ncbi:DNA cytosine methyltransferase [Agrococcus sediminis]|uniref:Cytosine-specific methyltransferase n=1 Tax=Agrococcus sediminis TaxID=2599924 RepID=A0A5M8QM12_9MICO|nr:DNA cytosine methyltransferase [Agrococcus sediminis]KAA6436288.1 DNA cytosine methyltransferase [Agrococcus sediminis]
MTFAPGHPVEHVDRAVGSIRVLDLFAGAGGLTAGFHSASRRFKSVRAVEWDRDAAASYTATFGQGIVFAGPIQEWLALDEQLEVDIVVGGPPCQGFSTLGKQNEEDERNTLWREYARSIERYRPKYFVVENVTAFFSSPQFSSFTALMAPGGALSEYRWEAGVLNSADFGAFQARKRAIVIGSRRDMPLVTLPTPTHHRDSYATVAEAFVGIPAAVDAIELSHVEPRGTVLVDGVRRPMFAPADLHLGRRYTELSLARFKAIPQGGNRFSIEDHDLLPKCWKNHRTGSADVMGRLHWDRPSVTIRTEFFKPEKGRYLHPTANRAITHYEAAVLQGFPRSHRFVGSKTSIARQIGNAVPIPLGRAIATQIQRGVAAAEAAGSPG